MDRAKDIEQYGKDARGKRELLRHLMGERLTMKQGILAMCYDCNGYYADGKLDCLVPGCPLYGFMPYREDREKVKRERSAKQVEATRRLALLISGGAKNSVQEQGESAAKG